MPTPPQPNRRLGLPVLVGYPDAVMDAEWFYDSNNHLNTAGAQRYTAALLEKLAAAAERRIKQRPRAMAATAAARGHCFTKSGVNFCKLLPWSAG